MRALLLAGDAPRACRAILRRRRPDVVLGGGGYVAGPMVVAARSLGSRPRSRRRTRTSASRTGSRRRSRSACSSRTRCTDATGAKYEVVGRPIPSRSRPIPRDEAREIFELDPDAPILGVFGALAGAKALNEFVVDTWGEAGPAILHLTGRRDYDDVRRRVARPDYRVLAETERFGAALSAVDLVLVAVRLARCGRSPPPGRPAILVPYPFATGDHQALNAEHFVHAGGAIMVRELDLDDVPELVRSLLDDPVRCASMGAAMLRAARPDAAESIADELLRLAQ